MYNSKELNENFGLDWYNYGFRMYDASIGRFSSVDPAADQFAFVSPFNYAENTPIGSIDLWGLQKYETTHYDKGRMFADMSESKREQYFEENKYTAAVGGAAMVVATGGFVAVASGVTAAGVGTVLANEAKDEAISQATGGVSDIFDITKQVTKVGKQGLGMLLKPDANVVTDVISETKSSKGNILSSNTLTENEALDKGIKFVGDKHTELGKQGSGVFRSDTPNADGTVNQFRMDNNSLNGNHLPNVPHVHFEIFQPNKTKPVVNNHVEIRKD